MPGIKFAIEKKYLKNRIWKKKKMADNLAWGECARKKEEKKKILQGAGKKTWVMSWKIEWAL